jgi:hypothetical protein
MSHAISLAVQIATHEEARGHAAIYMYYVASALSASLIDTI